LYIQYVWFWDNHQNRIASLQSSDTRYAAACYATRMRLKVERFNISFSHDIVT